MTVVITDPDSTAQNTGALTGGTPADAVLSDESNSTYVQLDSGESVRVGFANPTIPVGALVKKVEVLETSQRTGTPQSELVTWLSPSGTTGLYAGFFRAFLQQTLVERVGATYVPASGANPNDVEYVAAASGSGVARITELNLKTTYVAKPTVVVDAPSGDVGDNTSPTVEWTPTLDSDGGPQVFAIVKVFSAAQYGAPNFNPDTTIPVTAATEADFVVEGSGVVGGAATEWKVEDTLEDGVYRAYVQSYQAVNGRFFGSAWNYSQFTVAVERPEAPTLTLTPDSTNGRIGIEVEASGSGITPLYTVIERSADEGGTWTPVRTNFASGLTLFEGGEVNLYDYEAPIGLPLLYRAKAGTFVSGFNAIDSAWNTAATSWEHARWWLKHPTLPANNLPLVLVSFVGYDREARQSVKQAIGGQAVTITDTRGPKTGQIVLRVDTEAEMDALHDLASLRTPLLLQPPADDHEVDRWVVLGNESTRRLVDKSWANARDVTYDWTEVPRPDDTISFETEHSIELVAIGTVSQNDGVATTTTPAIPAEAQEGHFLLAVAACRQQNRTWVAPTGWTELYQTPGTSGVGPDLIFYGKTHDGSEANPVIGHNTVSGQSVHAQVIVLDGVDPDEPLDIAGTPSQVGTEADLNVGPVSGIEPQFPGGAILAFGVYMDNLSSLTFPGGDGLEWTQLHNSVNAFGGGMISDLELAIASSLATPSIGAKTWTGGSGAVIGSSGVILALAADPRPVTANVLREDLVTDANAYPLWGNITTAWPEQATNNQVEYRTTDGDPYYAVGKVAASSHYRRLKTEGGTLDGSHSFPTSTIVLNEDISGWPDSGWVQVVDSGRGFQVAYSGKSGAHTLTGCVQTVAFATTVPDNTPVRLKDVFGGGSNTTNYRAQIGAHGARAFWLYRHDSTVTTLLSFRLQNPTNIDDSVGEDSQVWQIKQQKATGATQSASPILSMVETETDLVIRRNYLEHTVEPFELASFPADKGVWHRMAITCRFHNDPNVGWIEVYADLSGGSGAPDFDEVLARTYLATAYPSPPPSAGPQDFSDLSIGPYSPTTLAPVYRDYANIQIVENWTP